MKILIKLIFIIPLLLFTTFSAWAKDIVITLHGLARTHNSMNKIVKSLEENGYDTLNIDYSSRKYSIKDIAQKFILPEIEKLKDQNYDKVHFVGYSLGGIIVRYIVENHEIEKLGRVVLVATANKGSEVADYLDKYRIFSKIFGPSGGELKKNSEVIKNLQSKISYDAGVIAGNASYNPFFSIFVLPGPDDGTVSVESTHLEGAKHKVISASHAFLLLKKKSIKNIVHFIKYGDFL